jgi:4-hydroxy-tetrahydrodipicolinate reductase
MIMNIALVGYGRMGHEIEEAAEKRGHNVKLRIDVENRHDLIPEKLEEIDVVIIFTVPEAALESILKCLDMKKPVVTGSTGWLGDYDKAVEACKKNNTSFIYSSNFSVGVNILFRLNSLLAGMMSPMTGYIPSIEEIHHTKKLDAPSGTAITLAGGISEQHKDYSSWARYGEEKDNSVIIKSVREGEVPGTHTITWDSEIDRITLRHEAKGRKGFAFGAVLAAEFISSRKGLFTMNDVLGF